ncbi:MAG: hypothetical protein M0033_12860 [Nitrospiraceae bacterium]|nr:hypothetical protein [Nitrospiraceae bacterium]
MKKKLLSQKLIEIKSLENDFVVLERPGSLEIKARAKTYDGAREKAILLDLELPMIVREKYLVNK